MAFSAVLLGKKLQAARQKKGYKQSYVAEKVDFSDVHLSRIENGVSPIYVHKLSVICELLDVTMTEVLAEAQDPMSSSDMLAAFCEISDGCSEETKRAMLDVCRAIAQAEKRAKGE